VTEKQTALVSRRRVVISEGVIHYPGYLDRNAQEALVGELTTVLDSAPFYRPTMPDSGKPLSVEMSNCGSLGWVSDAALGYRYQAYHPETGRAWPPIPSLAMKAWWDLAAYPFPPEACLINHYDAKARMGLHQDKDEQEMAAPVVSLSLGDSCQFRIGGISRKDPTQSLRLSSGDGLILSGPSRLAFHGVDRILAGSSTLWPGGGRINLTLRRVTRPS
jgi:alkylated DNA repair protein (DNA oxidative demethylase)